MKFGMKILGCPKNDADSDAIIEALQRRGHEFVQNVEKADAVLVNTCAFIDSAKEESIDAILELCDYKGYHGGKPKVMAIGCMAQRYPHKLADLIPELNGVIGLTSPENIASLVEKSLSKRVIFSETTPDVNYRSRTHRYVDKERIYEYVKIADGCDNRCSFCSIPFFKGGYRSRNIISIEDEVKHLVEKEGVKEIILVAQDTSSYGKDLPSKPSLADLIYALDRIEEDFWIRVLYLYPSMVTDELLDAFTIADKVLPYFDIPFQHFDDDILRAMGRKMISQEIERLLGKIRTKIPKAAIRTSVIVGFPGEGEKEFKHLTKFIEKARFDNLGVFIYSPQEGTPAKDLPNKVPLSIAHERQKEVTLLQNKISSLLTANFLGKEMKVIVEKYDEESKCGRTYRNAPEIDGVVFFCNDSKVKVGDFVRVKLTQQIGSKDLQGEVLL